VDADASAVAARAARFVPSAGTCSAPGPEAVIRRAFEAVTVISS
jgi:hypothetical protein